MKFTHFIRCPTCGKKNKVSPRELLIKSLFGFEVEIRDENGLDKNWDSFFNNLTEREKRVLESTFGLDGEKPKSYRKTASCFNLSSARIGQIALKAMRKLRHPKSSRLIKEYLKFDYW